MSSLPSSLQSSLPAVSTSLSVGDPIDHKTLIALARLSKSSLSTLLTGSSIYVAPRPTPLPPSPEYLALKQRLLEQQEKRDYAVLVNHHALALEDEPKDDISPSLVFNILLSVLLCAAAVFYATRYIFNDGLRVLVSLLAGIVVGLAEVTVYAGYLRKVEESRRKERRKKEVKSLVGEFAGEEVVRDGKSAEIQTVISNGNEGDKEEIWGKGRNGGMRRRVREKWEQEQNRTAIQL